MLIEEVELKGDEVVKLLDWSKCLATGPHLDPKKIRKMTIEIEAGDLAYLTVESYICNEIGPIIEDEEVQMQKDKFVLLAVDPLNKPIQVAKILDKEDKKDKEEKGQ